MGKILLAYLPAKHRSHLISQTEFAKRCPTTITSPPALKAQLDIIRKEGLAISDEEHLAGACALAAPVRDQSGDAVAAVSVSAYGGMADVNDLRECYDVQLLATVQRISKRLGWNTG